MSMTEKLSRKVEVLVAWLFVALLSCGLYAAPAYADLNEAGDSGFSESESGAGTNEPMGSWRVDSHGWWYELANGSYPRSQWLNLGGTWYYLAGSGAMATGWQVVNGSWYYMEPSGAMKTGWLLLDDTWYFLSGSGAMQTGWQMIGGAWYYFYGSGAMAASTWVGNYYLTSSGAMATNQRIDDCYVGSDGAWIPGYSSGGSYGTWDGVTVYWTANGKAWHKSRSCPSLSRSNPIQGTLSQVGGRTRCKVCGGH